MGDSGNPGGRDFFFFFFAWRSYFLESWRKLQNGNG